MYWTLRYSQATELQAICPSARNTNEDHAASSRCTAKIDYVVPKSFIFKVILNIYFLFIVSPDEFFLSLSVKYLTRF